MNIYRPPEVPYGAQPEPWQTPRRPPRNGRTPAGPRPATYPAGLSDCYSRTASRDDRVSVGQWARPLTWAAEISKTSS
jgi:hypothetical protein